MGRRFFSVLLLAVLGGAMAFFFVQMYQPKPQAVGEAAPVAVQAADTVQLLVAAKDIPAGTLVQPNSLIFRAWPKSAVDDASHVVEGKGTMEEFDGAVVRTGIRSGEPLVRGNFIKRGEKGFLAAVLKPGMRAATVAVNENTGVAGFVFPGDKVDLIMSHTVQVKMADGQEHPHKVSETIMHDIRVIAIDQRAGDQDQNPSPSRVVTVEVTADQAEKIALAQQIGEVRLVLRPLTNSQSEEDAAQAGQGTAVGQVLGGEGSADVAVPTMTIDSQLSQIISPPSGSDGSGSSNSIQVVRGGTAADTQVK